LKKNIKKNGEIIKPLQNIASTYLYYVHIEIQACLLPLIAEKGDRVTSAAGVNGRGYLNKSAKKKKPSTKVNFFRNLL